MSLAAETRRAVRDRPFLLYGLRAGVVNFTAAARLLDVEGDVEAIATALSRYADELPGYETAPVESRVRMEAGIGPVEGPEDAVLVVGGTALGPGDGTRTAVLATGAVGADALEAALARLSVAGVSVVAAGVGADTMAIVVDRLDGADALRAVERALEAVPTDG